MAINVLMFRFHCICHLINYFATLSVNFLQVQSVNVMVQNNTLYKFELMPHIGCIQVLSVTP